MDNILREINIKRAIIHAPPILPQFERNSMNLITSTIAYLELSILGAKITEPTRNSLRSPIYELIESIGLYQVSVQPLSNRQEYASIEEDGFNDAIEQRIAQAPTSTRDEYEAYMRGYFEGRYTIKMDTK